MIRSSLLLLLLVVGCGASKSPATSSPPEPPGGEIETVEPTDPSANPNCAAGNWVPQSQEPPHYVACTAHAECVKMVLPGCCSETYVAIRRDHACGTDLGSQCDMVCDEVGVRPEGAHAMRAACIANKCTLVR